MDNADRAQEQLERIEAQRLQRRALDQQPVTSATHCLDCCDEITPERRAACPGCKRCADCAQDYERRL